MVRDYKRNYQTLLPVRDINLKAYTTNNPDTNYLIRQDR